MWPIVVIPPDFDRKNKTLSTHVYMHELAHIKSNDNALGLAALLISCLHWFNPFAWVAYKMLCLDIELACDAKVVKKLGCQKRKEYASSLLCVAQNKRSGPMFLTSFLKNNIKERVINVMNVRKFNWKIFGACTLSVLLIAGFLLYCHAREKAGITLRKPQAALFPSTS